MKNSKAISPSAETANRLWVGDIVAILSGIPLTIGLEPAETGKPADAIIRRKAGNSMIQLKKRLPNARVL